MKLHVNETFMILLIILSLTT